MSAILDAHIQPAGDHTYAVTLFQRGNTQPLANSSFEFDLSAIAHYEIGRLEIDPKDPHGRMERIKHYGRQLYDKLFNPEIAKLWQEYKAKNDFLTLCLRLAPEAADLEALPWETLYDGDEFLAAGAKTGLSRLPLDIKIQEDLSALDLPLRMLGLLSSPLNLEDHERLQIEREQEILLQAVNSPVGQGKLLLEFEDEAKLPIVEQALDEPCQIFHYSGHGLAVESGGGLLLEDSEGNKRPVSISEFLHVLERADQSLRLAVLSGCQTAKTLGVSGLRHLARGLLDHHIPAVIAMQFSITDEAGLVFAENLYPRLFEGQKLEIAVSVARRALLHHDRPHVQADAFAPVLFAATSEPLKTQAPSGTTQTRGPEIDFSFHLPLPQLSTGFFGRRREYRQIRDGLLNKGQRAIIIHGIGGVGKTALASHIARRLKDRLQGVYAFDCTKAALAPETVLLDLHRYLELRGIGALGQLIGKSLPPEQLGTYIGQVLSQLNLLIIFDNFETHLEPGDGDAHQITNESLAQFLKTLVKTTAGGSRFLFTTRYLFDIDAKRVGDIQELPLNDLSRPEALGLMQQLPYLSVAGFAEKTQAYETFGGHPYALVTLDRHCAHQGLSQVLLDAQAIHTELREFLAIEMSYAKLSDRARNLLNRLAPFRQPVPPDAAQWVLGEKVNEEIVAKTFFKYPDLNSELKKLDKVESIKQFKNDLPEQQTADVNHEIQELIRWGLLTPIQEEGDTHLLFVHSLIRDFCRDKLAPETWRNHLRDAAAYYTNQTKFLQKDQKSPAAVWMEIEAFELLFQAKDFEQAALLLFAVTIILNRLGFGRFLESLYRRIVPKLAPKLQTMAMGNIATLLQVRGDYDAAITEHQRVLTLFETLKDRRNIGTAYYQIGIIYHERGEYDRALEHYLQARKIMEGLSDRAGIGKALHQIGWIYQERGDYDQALDYYQRSLTIKDERDDRPGISASLHHIGSIYFLRGDYDRALKYSQQAQMIHEELGDLAGLSASLHQIGIIYQERGDLDLALEHYQ